MTSASKSSSEDPHKDGPRRYAAFISYNREHDARLAANVQRAMQRFAKRWNQRRAMEVFRDETGLPLTDALWAQIHENLSDSDHLILVASPASSASAGVAKEVAWWLEHRSVKTLHIILADGNIHWDEQRSGFHPEKTNALSPKLQRAYAEEPGFADLRWMADEPEQTLKNEKLRSAIRQVVASVRETTPEQVFSLEQQVLARNLFWARTAVLLLLMLAVGLAWTASIARQQTKIAEFNQRATQARRLAASAQIQSTSELDLALHLASESYRILPTVEGQRALLTCLTAKPRELRQYITAPLGGARRLLSAQDGKSIIAFDGGTMIQRLDAETLLPLAEPLSIASSPAVAVALSPDGSHLACGHGPTHSYYGALSFYSLEEKAIERVVELDNKVECLSYHPDGTRLVIGVGSDIFTYHLETQKLEKFLPNAHDSSELRDLAFAPDGMLASVGRDRAIRLWDFKKGIKIRDLAPEVTRAAGGAIAISPDGKHLAAPSDEGMLLWRLSDGRLVRRLKSGGYEGRKAVFSRNSKLLAAACGRGGLVVWNIESGARRVGPYEGRSHRSYEVVFAPDEQKLLTSGEGRIVQWSTQPEAYPIATQTYIADEIEALGLSPQGDMLAVSVQDRGEFTVRFYRIHGDTLGDIDFETPPSTKAQSVTWPPSGNRIAWTEAQSIVIRDLESQRSRVLDGQEHEVTSLAFSDNGKWLASGDSKGNVIFWDAETGVRQNVSAGYPYPSVDFYRDVRSLAWSSDSRRVLVGSASGDVFVWGKTENRWLAPGGSLSPENLGWINPGSGKTLVSFLDDGAAFLACRNNQVEVIGSASGQRVADPVDLGADHFSVEATAFSRRADRLAACLTSYESVDGIVTLVDGESWEALASGLDRLPNQRVVSLSEDGRLMATGDGDGYLTLWNLDEAQWREIALRFVAARPLSPGEKRQFGIGGLSDEG